MQHHLATPAGEKACGPDVGKFVDIIATIWPDVVAYPPGTRFRICDRDRRGIAVPKSMRGRTGTVIAEDGPVVVGDRRSRADVRDLTTVGLCDVASRIGVIIEMIHVVSFDEAPAAPLDMPLPRLLSHTWMEPR